MCGIYGFSGFRDDDLLRRMGDVLEHRGPDDRGEYVEDDVSLGNRRLSIIDLAGGHQPIHNEEKTVWITYNGEIYNFHELRDDLINHGHRFYTKTDTEVIVHGYEVYGLNFLRKLNGMYAFALWDARNHRLLLARDRAGIKPLYYAKLANGSIVFGSEIKSILQCKRVQPKVNVRGLQALMNLMYIPGAQTLFEGIWKLAPGHCLSSDDGKVSLQSYWDIEDTARLELSEEQCAEKLVALLESAIRRHMISDVPVAAFLSGGMDTSTIVALMAKLTEEPVQTFCMGFGEPTDEFEDARYVAEHFGTNHRELLIRPDVMEAYPKALWHTDTPMFNLYPYFISEFVSKHVKVVMSGLGGDELFGGYVSRYRPILKMENVKRHLPGLFMGAATRTASLALRFEKSLVIDRLRRYAKTLSKAGDKADFYLLVSGALTKREKSEAYGDALPSDDADPLKNEFAPFFRKDKADFLEQVLKADFKRQLPDYYLMVDDAMTMAHSVEARVPFLDGELIEFGFRLPIQLKVRGGEGKYILRKAMSKILPHKILKKGKWGFSVDVYSWYKGEMGELAKQCLPNGVAASKGYVKRRYLERVLKQRPRPSLTRQYALLWILLLFEIWHRIYMEGNDLYRPHLSMSKLL